MKKIVAFLLVCFFIQAFTFLNDGNAFIINNGVAKFTTKGPFGVIVAQSNKLTGTFDAEKKKFTISIPIASFQGFRNTLQKKHFNEKYLESDKIPTATFNGKIIEEVDFRIPGTYTVRAKGTMTIHGVEKEMIIKSKIIVKTGLINVESFFNVPLQDYNIKIVMKGQEDVAVEVKMDMLTAK